MTTNNLERNFLAFVQQHKAIGYGRMFQIILRQWYRSTGNVALVPPLAALSPEQQAMEVEAALHTDPVFQPARPAATVRCGNGDPALLQRAMIRLDREAAEHGRAFDPDPPAGC